MNAEASVVLRLDLRPYSDCLLRDAAFHAYVAAYAVVGLVLGIVAGVPHKFVPLSYVGAFAGVPFQILAIVVAGIGLWSLRCPSPIQAFGEQLMKTISPNLVAGLLLFASLTLFMGVFTSIKSMLPDMVPFFADQQLADIDRMLHGGRAPWRYTTSWVPPQLVPALEQVYHLVWGLCLSGATLAALLLPRLRRVRSQYLWAFLIVWPLLGNVVAAAVMSAGPVYYDDVTGATRFAGLEVYLQRHSMVDHLRTMLWNIHAAGRAGLGSGISAFPSMHVANTMLFVLLAAHMGKALKWVAILYGAVILFASVHLGWHYAVDGYFSVAATVPIWWGVGRPSRCFLKAGRAARASRFRNTQVKESRALEMTTAMTATNSATVIGIRGAKASSATRLTT